MAIRKFREKNGRGIIVYEIEESDTEENLEITCACGCGKAPEINETGKKQVLDLARLGGDKTIGVYCREC